METNNISALINLNYYQENQKVPYIKDTSGQ